MAPCKGYTTIKEDTLASSSAGKDITHTRENDEITTYENEVVEASHCTSVRGINSNEVDVEGYREVVELGVPGGIVSKTYLLFAKEGKTEATVDRDGSSKADSEKSKKANLPGETTTVIRYGNIIAKKGDKSVGIRTTLSATKKDKSEVVLYTRDDGLTSDTKLPAARKVVTTIIGNEAPYGRT